jgi:hypothetical protein
MSQTARADYRIAVSNARRAAEGELMGDGASPRNPSSVGCAPLTGMPEPFGASGPSSIVLPTNADPVYWPWQGFAQEELVQIWKKRTRTSGTAAGRAESTGISPLEWPCRPAGLSSKNFIARKVYLRKYLFGMCAVRPSDQATPARAGSSTLT